MSLEFCTFWRGGGKYFELDESAYGKRRVGQTQTKDPLQALLRLVLFGSASRHLRLFFHNNYLIGGV